MDITVQPRGPRYCYEQGLAVVVVGYPAVPFDGVRARFCMSAAHSEEQVAAGRGGTTGRVLGGLRVPVVL